MSFDDLVSGTVFVYPYLWGHQADRGETEGRKDRPVVVGLRLGPKHGHDRVLLLPVTSKPPSEGRLAVEIPENEKRRAGLGWDMRLWIMLDDVNTDSPGKSYYITNARPLGRFSRVWFVPLMTQYVRNLKSVRMTDRSR